ncbi:MAG: hypothetical protein ACLP9L_22150 [Thermoguttaceae bacterium]
MKTIEELQKHLNKTYSTLEAWVQLGEPDFYTGLEATELANEAFRLACRFGCDVPLTTPTSALEALSLVGRLLAWATPAEPEGMLNLEKAAAYLGCTAHGLRKVVQRTQRSRVGEHTTGPTIEFHQTQKGGTIYFRREWLDEYIEANHHRPGTPAAPKVRKRSLKPETASQHEAIEWMSRCKPQ